MEDNGGKVYLPRNSWRIFIDWVSSMLIGGTVHSSAGQLEGPQTEQHVHLLELLHAAAPDDLLLDLLLLPAYQHKELTVGDLPV